MSCSVDIAPRRKPSILRNGDVPHAVAAYLECIAGGLPEEFDHYNRGLCGVQMGDQMLAGRALRTAMKWNAATGRRIDRCRFCASRSICMLQNSCRTFTSGS